ncbi:unnamed protein product [Bursaphelenchus xylophilus]|uniref:(pine wood nematode) hypothetical protein n=1 Tax=Bursaphelenchus xylophilus TaxID=6326 RepID=A0A811LJ31_BURXY|nr:unnamed protein product [Bursaphelenchus xylophilus]CAG9118034.1 unnamed protein product [Bursaphelenchus xylophilus]
MLFTIPYLALLHTRHDILLHTLLAIGHLRAIALPNPPILGAHPREQQYKSQPEHGFVCHESIVISNKTLSLARWDSRGEGKDELGSNRLPERSSRSNDVIVMLSTLPSATAPSTISVGGAQRKR